MNFASAGLPRIASYDVLKCNTSGVMVTKTGHVIICIAKHSCYSQLCGASTKTKLHL
jgi:hypothetical protein